MPSVIPHEYATPSPISPAPAAGHTPGPWTYAKAVRGFCVYVGPPTHAADVIHVGSGGGPSEVREEDEANAALIASAPDLANQHDALRAENAALREALEALADEYQFQRGEKSENSLAYITARALLAQPEQP